MLDLPIGPPPPGPWADDAHCLGLPTEIFYAPKGGRPDYYDEARAICGQCDVEAECLTYAIELPEKDDWGFWGGTSAADRRRIRKSWRTGEPLKPSLQPKEATVREIQAMVAAGDLEL